MRASAVPAPLSKTLTLPEALRNGSPSRTPKPAWPTSVSATLSATWTLTRAPGSGGYSPRRDYEYIEINRVLRAMHPEVITDTIGAIERLGGAVRIDPVTDLLTVNDEFTASIVLSRSFQTTRGALRWRIRLDSSLRPDITVALRLDASNRAVFDYYLLPRIDIAALELRLSEENGFSLDTYRFDTLEPFFYLAARTRIRMAA
jgi:hypothetical protein